MPESSRPEPPKHVGGRVCAVCLLWWPLGWQPLVGVFGSRSPWVVKSRV